MLKVRVLPFVDSSVFARVFFVLQIFLRSGHLSGLFARRV
ncbi:hypothetical protein TRICHSKD4_5977 [Roseibium sp. TrichSKD4]|nr:hypothetical protein TRICHSKD4_5977 [Roseibium sp. TrichSKD4]